MSIPVTSEIIRAETKRKGRRIYESQFLVTMSTNFRPKSEPEAAIGINDLERAAEILFGSDSLPNIVVFRKEGSWTPDWVQSARTKSKAEIGKSKKGSHLHIHSQVIIRHFSNIRLDQKSLKEEVNNILRDLGSRFRIHYVNIRFTGDPLSIPEYMEKDIQ